MKTRLTPIHRPALVLLGLLLVLAGCREKQPAAKTDPHAGHQHHVHRAPHGGAAVELGEEEYHLEFILDPVGGKLRAYVLDGELEKFIRLTNQAFAVQVTGQPAPLNLLALTNSATGETLGDTSAFETQANWLRGMTNFDAVIPSLDIRSKTYRDVKFNFPRGHEGK